MGALTGCDGFRPQISWGRGGRYEDAKAKLEACAAAGERFDVIIMDICDPLDAGPGWSATVVYLRVSLMVHSECEVVFCSDDFLSGCGR